MGVSLDNSTFAMASFHVPSPDFNLGQQTQSNGNPGSPCIIMPANALGGTSIHDQTAHSISSPAPSAPTCDTSGPSVAYIPPVRGIPSREPKLPAVIRTSSSLNSVSRSKSPLAAPSRAHSPFATPSRAHSPFAPVSRASSPFGRALGQGPATQARRLSTPQVYPTTATPSRGRPLLADRHAALPQQRSRAATPMAAQTPKPTTPVTSRSRVGQTSALRTATHHSGSIVPGSNHRPPSTPTVFGRPSRPQSASPRSLTRNRQAGSSASQPLPQLHPSPAHRSETPLPSTPCPGPRPDVLPPSPAHMAETMDDHPMVHTDSAPQDVDEEPPVGWGEDADGQGVGNADRMIGGPHRVRTPPPSRNIFRPLIVSAQQIADSDGFIVNESDLLIASQSTHANILPSRTISAPTTMELRVKRDKEIKDIYGGRKSKPSEKGDLVKGAKRIGDFEEAVQGVMAVMKASVLHTYVARAGFCEDSAVSLQRAQEYAKEHLKDDVDGIVDAAFLKTVSDF